MMTGLGFYCHSERSEESQPLPSAMSRRGNNPHLGKNRKTRRELFLQRMDGLIPWQKMEERIRPGYPKPGKVRRPYPPP